MKKIIFFLLVALPSSLLSQQNYSAMEVSHSELAPGIHRLFVGNAVTVIAFNGHDGLLLIDAAYEKTTSQLRDTLNRMFGKPVSYLINTHLHADHTGGNIEFGKGAKIIAHKSVKTWLASERKQDGKSLGPMPEYAIPQIFVEDSLQMKFNDQAIKIKHLSGGHTEGDIIVSLPESNVLILGDLLFADNFPFIDIKNGGNPFTLIKHLNYVVNTFNDSTIFVGGHGPVYSIDQLQNYIYALTQTIDIITDEKLKGKSAEQIKNAHTLQRWDSFGKFFITVDKWIDTIYPLATQGWQEL